MLSAAIVGMLGAVIAIFFINKIRNSKFEKAAQAAGATFSIRVYMANAARFKQSIKIYDSFGVAYIVGKKCFI